MSTKTTLVNSLTVAAGMVMVLVVAQPATAQVIKVEVGIAGMT